jgi:ferredoxin
MTYVITEPCIDVNDKTCAGEWPVASICEGDLVLCIRSGACVDCDAGEPACPVEAISCEHDVPGQQAQFTTENVRFSGQLGSPGGASRTGPLRCDTGHVTSRCRRGGQARRGARRPAKGGGNLHRYRLEVRLTAPTPASGSLSAGAGPAQVMASRSPTCRAFLRRLTPDRSRSASMTGGWSWSPPGAHWPAKWCRHRRSASAVPAPGLPDRRLRGRGMATVPLPPTAARIARSWKFRTPGAA